MESDRGNGIPRRKWAPAEDKILVSLVKKHGTGNWRTIASQIRGREPKQCRERWLNHLDPSVRKGHLTNDEWEVVVRAHNAYGNRWSDIAKLLPGRTPNQIKNYWHSSQRITAIYMSQARKTKRSRSEDDSEDDVEFVNRRRALAEEEMPTQFRESLDEDLDDLDPDQDDLGEETTGNDEENTEFSRPFSRSSTSLSMSTSSISAAATASLRSLSSSITLSFSPSEDLGEEIIETPSLSPLAQQPQTPYLDHQSYNAQLFGPLHSYIPSGSTGTHVSVSFPQQSNLHSARWAALSQLAIQLYLSEHLQQNDADW